MALWERAGRSQPSGFSGDRQMTWSRFVEEILDHDGDVPDADAGGVVDGVGDGGGHADDGDFADSFGTDGIVQGVGVFDEVDVDVGDVGVDGYQVAGEVAVGQPAVLFDLQTLVQGGGHAPD